VVSLAKFKSRACVRLESSDILRVIYQGFRARGCGVQDPRMGRVRRTRGVSARREKDDGIRRGG